jgi:hypothetical protein
MIGLLGEVGELILVDLELDLDIKLLVRPRGVALCIHGHGGNWPPPTSATLGFYL